MVMLTPHMFLFNIAHVDCWLWEFDWWCETLLETKVLSKGVSIYCGSSTSHCFSPQLVVWAVLDNCRSGGRSGRSCRWELHDSSLAVFRPPDQTGSAVRGRNRAAADGGVNCAAIPTPPLQPKEKGQQNRLRDREICIETSTREVKSNLVARLNNSTIKALRA